MQEILVCLVCCLLWGRKWQICIKYMVHFHTFWRRMTF